MKRDTFLRNVVILGFVICSLYFVVFYGIEGCRHRQGPWRVTFGTNDAGPFIQISQTKLQKGALIEFPGESVPATNYPQVVDFDRPKKSPPFGRVIYEDLMQLPGVITFDLFGHEIELLPRTLIVNRKQILWAPGMQFRLVPGDKLPATLQPRPSWRTNQ